MHFFPGSWFQSHLIIYTVIAEHFCRNPPSESRHMLVRQQQTTVIFFVFCSNLPHEAVKEFKCWIWNTYARCLVFVLLKESIWRMSHCMKAHRLVNACMHRARTWRHSDFTTVCVWQSSCHVQMQNFMCFCADTPLVKSFPGTFCEWSHTCGTHRWEEALQVLLSPEDFFFSTHKLCREVIFARLEACGGIWVWFWRALWMKPAERTCRKPLSKCTQRIGCVFTARREIKNGDWQQEVAENLSGSYWKMLLLVEGEKNKTALLVFFFYSLPFPLQTGLLTPS